MPSFGVTQALVENNFLGGGTVSSASSTLSINSTLHGNSFTQRIDISFSGTVTLNDNVANGSTAWLNLFTFPQGVLELGGGYGSVTLTKATANTGTAATGAFVIAVGTQTANNDNATLLAAEANILPSQAATLVAGTKSTLLNINGTTSFVDGSTANKSLYLNMAVPQAGNTGSGQMTISGIIRIPICIC